MRSRLTEPAPTASDRRYTRSEMPARRGGESVDHVALVTLDRPEAHNALSFAVLSELADTLETLDADAGCHCIVLTGAGERAFAAGADIRELAAQTPVSLLADDEFRHWDRIKRIRTPIVAAVRGVALGGGCELAMTCDVIVAAEDAQFGQPEIRLGVMPGAGGTQRLTRAVGKAKAMEMILTGQTMDGREAAAAGLVARVAPAEAVVDAALDLAGRIAAMPPLAAIAAKEAVNSAFELPLQAGLEFERRSFFLLFATDDQREGMAAFVEKRDPSFGGH